MVETTNAMVGCLIAYCLKQRPRALPVHWKPTIVWREPAKFSLCKGSITLQQEDLLWKGRSVFRRSLLKHLFCMHGIQRFHSTSNHQRIDTKYIVQVRQFWFILERKKNRRLEILYFPRKWYDWDNNTVNLVYINLLQGNLMDTHVRQNAAFAR